MRAIVHSAHLIDQHGALRTGGVGHTLLHDVAVTIKERQRWAHSHPPGLFILWKHRLSCSRHVLVQKCNNGTRAPQRSWDLSGNWGRCPLQVLFHPNLFVHLYSDAAFEIHVCSHSTPWRNRWAVVCLAFSAVGLSSGEWRSKVVTTEVQPGMKDLSKGRELPKLLNVSDKQSLFSEEQS